MYKRDIMVGVDPLQNIISRWGSPYVLARRNQIRGWGGGGGVQINVCCIVFLYSLRILHPLTNINT